MHPRQAGSVQFVHSDVAAGDGEQDRFASSAYRDLVTKIRAFITGWNGRRHPFIWTKPADEILDKINRKRKHVSTARY